MSQTSLTITCVGCGKVYDARYSVICCNKVIATIPAGIYVQHSAIGLPMNVEVRGSAKIARENLTAGGAGSTQTGQYNAPAPEITGSTASPSEPRKQSTTKAFASALWGLGFVGKFAAVVLLLELVAIAAHVVALIARARGL